MGFRLRKGEAVPEGLRRVVLEQLRRAESGLEAGGLGPHEGVHQARVSLKKTRALLRLLRKTGRWSRQESRVIRDLGRQLSATRDASSLVEALRRLSERHGNGDERAGALDQAGRVLVEKRSRVAASGKADGSLDETRAALAAVRARVDEWPLGEAELALLDKALAHSERRAAAALEGLHADSGSEAFHEFRKRVKVHLYQVRLMRGVSKRAAAEDLPRLERLAQFLGESQDLTLLLGAIAEDPVSFGGPAAVQQLRHLVETEQGRLRTKLLKLGRKALVAPAGKHHLEPTTPPEPFASRPHS